MTPRTRLQLMLVVLTASVALATEAKKNPYRLPGAERLPQVLWSGECVNPDGSGLAFGGEDQKSPDGAARTRIRVDGQWRAIHEQLRQANPLQKNHARAWALRQQVKTTLARLRFTYFEAAPAEAETMALLRKTLSDLDTLARPLAAIVGADDYHRAQARFVLDHLNAARDLIAPAADRLAKSIAPDDLKALHRAQVELEIAAESLDAEPPLRALSPIIYDPATRLFILFGGDHLDYLTSDTWVFDPAKPQWRQRHPKLAPPPRANHQLAIAGGKVTLKGGYTYYNDIWYCGGPYIDIGDGAWTYDIAADTWTSAAGSAGAPADGRTYRQKEFHPDFFVQGDRPDRETFGRTLKDLPTNTWVLTKPPHLPKMNRDWGTAVIDPDRDVLLRWSGGHSAHGGSDVLIYHFSTNRWELPFPIELPLGQTYSNTSYPRGVNLNQRPWVTGHTYKSYDYDPAARAMVFVGQLDQYHIFDLALGDWCARGAKPAGMTYGDCYYDLMCKRTPRGVVCWTKNGELFRFDGQAGAWQRLEVAGLKLPGSAVDSAGIDYDSRRDRLLIFPGRYGKPYTGQIITVDLKTLAAANANPEGMDLAATMPGLLRETCYVASADLVLTGVTMPPGEDGIRRTPAYDCAANRWRFLPIAGPSPAGKTGRNVSMGLVYDARRDLVWAVDAASAVHVLRIGS